MTFWKRSAPEPGLLMQTHGDLTGIPNERLLQEAGYWREVNNKSTFVHMQAADIMMQGLRTIAHLRQASALPPQILAEGGVYVEPLLRSSFAKLAMSQLLQTVPWDGTDGVEAVAALNFDAAGDAYLYVARQGVTEFFPSYEPRPVVSWYENQAIAVRAVTPADPDQYFLDGYRGVMDEQFVPENYVSLQPQLKRDYANVPVR